MKKVVTIILSMLLVFAFVGCGQANNREIRIGSSAFSITLPEGYASKEDNFDEDQIAYYHKDDDSVDFDVYLWAKEGIYTLEQEAEYFAGQYGVQAVAVEINGINGMKYVSTELYEGNEYKVVNYMFEDQVYIIELSFWTIDTQAEYAVVDEIIGTLKMN